MITLRTIRAAIVFEQRPVRSLLSVLLAAFLMLLDNASGADADRPSFDGWSDERLVREFLASRREELFSALVGRYKDKVLRLAHSILGPGFEAEAEDITQETFITVHFRLREFRFESGIGTWIYRIAYNRAIDYRRKPRFRLQHSDDAFLAEMAGAGGGPLAETVAGEKRRAVLRSVDALAEPYRTVVYLHYWMESPIEDISEYLEIKPSTVKSHLFRARQQLALALAGRI